LATFIFTVTLANVGEFFKFFQCRNQKEMAHNQNNKFPTVAFDSKCICLISTMKYYIIMFVFFRATYSSLSKATAVEEQLKRTLIKLI